ncbi:cation-binding protein [Rubrivivax gelatinosus]|uniref:hemerythrin domain-containing protein n=1 Tax=Rubrivivax gelatinosus TaxID=28068 RepID=UPI0019054098|nr:hemerythrin domain-containing protein [Rubrivivax gelatinosus]MBK1613718.1 cation-binding protein [Rubrivivax gelatinosus]
MATILLHEGPSVGFEAPFEMLEACHDRVERTLALLERLLVHLDRLGVVDEQARHAARDVMRYFDLAAPKHHEDEERHVFPALREQGQAALADRLQAEHGEMAAQWARLRPTLAAIVDGAWDSAAAPLWEAFVVSYRRHIVDEDEQACPAAAAAIDDRCLGRMAEEMAHRRGLR